MLSPASRSTTGRYGAWTGFLGIRDYEFGLAGGGGGGGGGDGNTPGDFLDDAADKVGALALGALAAGGAGFGDDGDCFLGVIS